ncbi:MAG: hypothetical protein NT069_13495 [Planctomycetota bacterium]|nr:hypothetical protein [Planctomycetota bacterium]
MIPIQRPASMPKTLRIKGRAATRRVIEFVQQWRSEIAAGKVKVEFEPEVYGAEDVKQALMVAQHDKCCFCESKISHNSHGDVEHFRPKAANRQAAKQKIERPGYYWLAYDWKNLLLCCQICNQRQKKNLFPLINPQMRARSDADDLCDESPLFINPAEESPFTHIGFRQEYAYSVGGGCRGDKTIHALGLNRPALAERRRDLLKLLEPLKNLRELSRLDPSSFPSELRQQLCVVDQRMNDSAEFAAMVRAFLG